MKWNNSLKLLMKIREEKNLIQEIKKPTKAYWVPKEKGDNLIGVLVEKGENLYTFEVEGMKKIVRGEESLNKKMDLVNVGDKLEITYKGDGFLVERFK